ncbi:monooxygenase [Tupanvirus soda lake]|uniref:Monooxygenase n=2 Tax=Tupanvirus TaxID=2094720 RepID=A0A6N1NJB4_9VIRU|nr:monooxygenase [Tupanvirus soda lake]QKU34915.1 monooxygenase [Tupanvirus soda lake]
MENQVDFLIIGGGISGLFMAFLLQKNGQTCKILERDASIDDRKQGFSLTMQDVTEKIFEEYGLLNDMYKYGNFTHSKAFYNSNGEILYESPMRNFNYPLPRQDIRRIFYSFLSKDTVVWNSYVVNVMHSDNTVTVVCNNNTTYCCKMLIACDGVNSRVRKIFLPNIKLHDFNLVNIYGLFSLDDMHPNDRKIIENKTIQILDGKNRIFSKPFDKHMQMWELTYPITAIEKPIATQKEALDSALNVTKQWNLKLAYYAVKLTKIEDIIMHPLYDYVPSLEDINNIPTNVVLIGDAIHPMAPTIGMGANEAIRDCYEFIKYLNIHKDKHDLAVKKYYLDMVMRANTSVMKSRDHAEFYHSEDSVDINKLSVFKKWN